MISFNTNQISNPPKITQALAIPVAKGETQGTIIEYNDTLLQNRNTAMSILDAMWMPYTKPEGSFYIFPQIRDTINDVKQACLDASKKKDWVVVIPWQAFWADRNVRISLASTPCIFVEWMNRFQKIFS